MSRLNSVNPPAHIDTSVLGEEDPGASLEILRSEALKAKAKVKVKEQVDRNPYLTVNCSNNGKCFTIQVQWQETGSREFSDLLGLVIAEHAVISDIAWAHHVQTGNDPVQLEMGATADGRAAVQVKSQAVPGHPGAPAARRKVLHEPYIAANDHLPCARQRQYC